MNLADYLDRIAVSDSFAPSFETLVTLHCAHMRAVPFENLDIPLGREIVMDETRFLDKIVRQKRGGFCYELNGAFAWLLRGVGFDVACLSARVYGEDGPGRDFDHMALLAAIDGERFLADVGFGDSFVSPLRLVADDVQRDRDPRGLDYRLTEDAGVWTMWKSSALGPRPSTEGGEWAAQYAFTLESRELAQYGPLCRHQQTSPESSFTRKVVCSRVTESGRITLTATTLVETTAAGRVETPVDRGDWHDVLRERLGVVLPAEIVQWP